MIISTETVVAIVGLGYVGLPLAVEFGKKYWAIGYDLSEAKIANYKNYCDPPSEVSTEDIKAATRLTVSTGPRAIGEADAIVAAVSYKKYLAMLLADILAKFKQGAVSTDVKSAYDPVAILVVGCRLWRP